MTKFFSCVLVLLCGVIVMAAETVNFDNAKPGAMPPGWTSGMTHNGGAPRWEVRSDDSAPSKPNVLGQLSDDRTSGRFPLAIYEKASIKDGEVSVKCKSISGRGDQACGIVWRYRDPNNYYIVRANALEDNVVLYKVEGGKRTDLDVKGAGRTYGMKTEVPKDAWSELRVIARGNLFTVYLNSRELFQVEDGTFREAGRVGLWTKADSVTRFDDLRFAGLDGGGQ